MEGGGAFWLPCLQWDMDKTGFSNTAPSLPFPSLPACPYLTLLPPPSPCLQPSSPLPFSLPTLLPPPSPLSLYFDLLLWLLALCLPLAWLLENMTYYSNSIVTEA